MPCAGEDLQSPRRPTNQKITFKINIKVFGDSKNDSKINIPSELSSNYLRLFHNSSKFHDANGCKYKGCDCKVHEAEEMEYKLSIDLETGKQICVICSSDKDLKKGLCVECRKKDEEKEPRE